MPRVEPSRQPAPDHPPVKVDLNTARWYALRTRPRHEKKVALQLQTRQVETFLPLLARLHRWSDRRKLVELPLFPGYAFVHMPYSNPDRLRVLQTPGVLYFVAAGGRALPIPEKQIEDIQKALLNKVACWPHPFLRVGQRVRIRGGCLDGIEGILLAANSDRSLLLSIEPISQSLRISIEGYDVEPI